MIISYDGTLPLVHLISHVEAPIIERRIRNQTRMASQGSPIKLVLVAVNHNRVRCGAGAHVPVPRLVIIMEKQLKPIIMNEQTRTLKSVPIEQ
jgi:hypothetical protein